MVCGISITQKSSISFSQNGSFSRVSVKWYLKWCQSRKIERCLFGSLRCLSLCSFAGTHLCSLFLLAQQQKTFQKRKSEVTAMAYGYRRERGHSKKAGTVLPEAINLWIGRVISGETLLNINFQSFSQLAESKYTHTLVKQINCQQQSPSQRKDQFDLVPAIDLISCSFDFYRVTESKLCKKIRHRAQVLINC